MSETLKIIYPKECGIFVRIYTAGIKGEELEDYDEDNRKKR